MVVTKNRVEAGQLVLERFAPEVLLLDDGFQHLKLKRDLDIVVIDASNSFGNGYLLPRGILREPLSSLKRAHLFCLTRVNRASDLRELKNQLRAINPEAPIVECIHRPCFLWRLPDGPRVEVEQLSGRKIFAFSALGNPESFEKSLVELGAELVGTMRFRDHYRYSVDDLERIVQQAQNSLAEVVVTTGKDSVNLPLNFASSIEICSLDIEIQVLKGMKYLNGAIDRL